MIFYLAGCNLLNDFSKENADQSSAPNGITGVWFPSNPRITLDTIKFEIGGKTLSFTHKDLESGIYFERDSTIATFYQDSSLHLKLQLRGRHLLINSYMAGITTGETMGYINKDSVLVLNNRISDIYCDGIKFEALDNQKRLCLGIYLEDSNLIRIRGYFVGTKKTMIIGDKDIKIFSRNSVPYQSGCDSALTVLLPRHDFRKTVSKL
jgi:hypothetical protein